LDPQDMRNMGGLRKRMPVTFWVYLVGSLALAGVAPLAGFFSKDEILVAASHTSPFIFGLLILAAFFTAFYVGRQLLMVFFGKERTPAAQKAVENPPIMTIPLVILALLSAFGGLLNFPGLHWLESWLEPVFSEKTPAEFVPLIAGASLLVALLGLVVAGLFYSQRRNIAVPGKADPLSRTSLGPVYRGMERKWWVDEVYQAVIITPYQEISLFLAEQFDQGLIDGVVNGLGWLAVSFSGVLRTLQNGYVRRYALSFAAGVVLILAYLLLR
jgi:NADH-quinone oxidoreductase subunit L